MVDGEEKSPAEPVAVVSTSGDEPPRLEYESAKDPTTQLAPEPETYGDVSLRGAYWTIGFSLVTKVVSFASQVALTWFLMPAEMGVVALAMTISGISALLATQGLVNLLVQRPGRIDDEAPQIFWLSLAMGIGAMLLTAACAPLAGRYFSSPQVVPLVLVITLCFPSSALGTIYVAKLMRDLKFKEVSGIYSAVACGKGILSVAMAAAGFGAYAIVIPLLLSQAGASALFRWYAGRIPVGRPTPRLWPVLLLPTMWLTAYGVANAVQMYGTNFVIGRLETTTVVGFYFWGFTLSAQAIFLLATGLRDILFPALAKLNDQPRRQAEGFRNALRLMTLVAVPVCVAQAVTADPLVRLLFESRWEPVIPVVEYLSLALVTQPMQVLAFALLMALGRFRLLTAVAAAQGALLVGTSIIGARAGAEREIAIWSGAGLAVGGVMAGYIAFRLLGSGWAGLLDSLRRTILPATVSGLLAWWAGARARPHGSIAEVITASAVLAVVYILLACAFAREDMVQLLWRLRLKRLSALLGKQSGTGQ